MQAVLVFDLPQDYELYKQYNAAPDYRHVIDTFRRFLRDWEEQQTNPPVDYIKNTFGQLLERIGYE